MDNTLTICTFKDLQNFISDNFFEFLHDAGITLCVCQNQKTKQNRQQNKSSAFHSEHGEA